MGRGTASTHRPGGVSARLPLRHLERLAHVGSLDAADKRDDSYEGAGLSVSLDPDRWTRIAGLSGERHWLTRPGGVFVEARGIGERQWHSIVDWGVEHGYVERVQRWVVAYHDDELGETMHLHVDGEAAAREEAEDLGGAAVLTEVLVGTEALAAALGVRCKGKADDHLLSHYVAQQLPDTDGVWWEDEPGPLWAPRGVISPHRVGLWTSGR